MDDFGHLVPVNAGDDASYVCNDAAYVYDDVTHVYDDVTFVQVLALMVAALEKYSGKSISEVRPYISRSLFLGYRSLLQAS